MKRKSVTLAWVCVLFVCFLIGANTGFAFEQEGVVKGNMEVAAFMNWYSISPDQGDSFDYTILGGSCGYFLTDPLEVGSQLQINDFDSDTSWSIRPFAKYHFFVSPTTTPYVGAALTYYDTDISGQDSSIGLNLNGGANFFITEKTAFSPELSYDYYSDYTITSLLLQLKIYF